jgi:hypothetical protein
MSKHRISVARSLLSLIVAFVLLLGSTASIFAQATPEASPTTGGVGPNIGDAVVLSDSNGDPALQIAVTQMVDPDEDVENVDRGFHFVSLEVVVNNPTDSDLEFNAYSIAIVDEQGFTYSETFGNRSEEDYSARPDFSESSVPAGESISGWLFFQVIDDAVPAWIVLNDTFSSQQFLVLANLSGETPALGDAVSFYNANAEEVGTVSVDEILPDFQKTDSEVDVERGQTAVGVVITIENTGSTDLDTSTATFYLIDDLGFQYYPQFFSRSEDSEAEYPELPTDPISAGDSATGLILFQLPSDAEAGYVTFQPDYSQLYIVAQPGEGSTVSGDTLTPVAAASPSDDVTPEDGDFGTPDDTNSSGGTETGDCVGVGAWGDAVNDALAPINENEALNAESLAEADPGDIRDAANQFADVANAIDDLDAPEVASDTSEATIALMNEYSRVLEDAADRIDNGDDPTTVENDLGNDEGLGEAFTNFSTALGDLLTTCPDSGIEDLLS